MKILLVVMRTPAPKELAICRRTLYTVDGNKFDKLTLYRASSKSSKGPVVPIITSGCPANSEKKTPDTDVAIRVSDIPMKFRVLSAKI